MGHQTIADAITQVQQKKIQSLSMFFTKNPYESLKQDASREVTRLEKALWY